MSARVLHLSVQFAAEPISRWGTPPSPSRDLPSQPLLHPHPRLLPLPPATLVEARSLRDQLAGLSSRERAAAADFLVALADFDQRRGWEVLGHRSLFAFLSRELHPSDGAAFVRISAARLLPQFPAVEAALRDGRLCLSTAGSLAAVLKPENQAEWLPRFFGLSARQAKELVATLAPRENPPRREVLSRLPQDPLRTSEVDRPERGASLGPEALGEAGEGCIGPDFCAIATPTPTSTSTSTPTSTSTSTSTSTVADLPLPSGERAGVRGTAPLTPASTIEPLSAELHRLHLTVSSRLVKKLAQAKDGLAHALPGATTEQVLEAALDLLLEKQARRKGLVKRPRRPADVTASLPAACLPGAHARPLSSAPADTEVRAEAGAEASTEASAEASARAGAGAGAGAGAVAGAVAGAEANAEAGAAPGPATARPRHIPAAVRREVWLRDGQRCQHPLDSGGRCGATHRLELDHVVPQALGGPSTAGNLRVACAFHNRAAARAILGEALMEDQQARARRGR